MCVCARERVCVSFSGFPGEHKITQEGEEESQLMFGFFFWLAVVWGRKQQDFAVRENSEAAHCEYLQLLFFFSSEILRQFLPDECKTRFGGLIGPECSF